MTLALGMEAPGVIEKSKRSSQPSKSITRTLWLFGLRQDLPVVRNTPSAASGSGKGSTEWTLRKERGKRSRKFPNAAPVNSQVRRRIRNDHFRDRDSVGKLRADSC